MLKNIENLSRHELKTILQNIGITDISGSKNTKKIKIQNKIPYGCFLVLSAVLYIIFISPIAFFYKNYMFLF